MEVHEVVVEAFAFIDIHAERDVKCFFARTADPEVAVALLVHADQALFENPRSDHGVVNLEELLRGQAKLFGALRGRETIRRFRFGLFEAGRRGL